MQRSPSAGENRPLALYRTLRRRSENRGTEQFTAAPLGHAQHAILCHWCLRHNGQFAASKVLAQRANSDWFALDHEDISAFKRRRVRVGIMRGRKRSGLWPPARTPDVVSHKDEAPIDADAQTDAVLLALVRLLARQAAREVFARTVTESDRSIDEGRE